MGIGYYKSEGFSSWIEVPLAPLYIIFGQKKIVPFEHVERFSIPEEYFTSRENILVYSLAQMWKYLTILLWGTNFN